MSLDMVRLPTVVPTNPLPTEVTPAIATNGLANTLALYMLTLDPVTNQLIASVRIGGRET